MKPRPHLPAPLRQSGRTFVLSRGRSLIYFGGCDYFRLASDPRILRAVSQGLSEHGLNVAASRATTGNHPLYEELERAAARFFRVESATLLSSGYLTNLAAAQALRGSIHRVFLDEQAHASLREAALILACPVTTYPHRQAGALARLLRKSRAKTPLAILTDGLFARTGAAAPLTELREIAGPEVLLWVDDAHAAGVLGRNGRGSIEEFGLSRRNTLQTVTFSKAFGTYGGAVLGGRELGDRIRQASSAFVSNTPVPLPLAQATLAALELMHGNPNPREKLHRNIRYFWDQAGQPSPAPLSPIIAVAGSTPRQTSERLLKNGIHPPLIRYPGGAAAQPPYFRFALSSEHTLEQIATLAKTIAHETFGG